jgi:hypothetical protein
MRRDFCAGVSTILDDDLLDDAANRAANNVTAPKWLDLSRSSSSSF